MKELLAAIHGGGDEAIEAATTLAGLAQQRRAYEYVMQASGEITDIVTVLRGVGFAAVAPEAGESANLLHYCVNRAADEIERLRGEKEARDVFAGPRWISASERVPELLRMVLVWSQSNGLHLAYLDSYRQWRDCDENPGKKITHWMPLPEPPESRQ